MKIWEVHGLRLDGAIRSTPDGEADVSGLVFSEKGYLLAVRDFRPHELVAMVRGEGEAATIARLLAHYGSEDSVTAAGGRKLVAVRGGSMAPGPVLRRNDEVPEMVGRS
ncbi:MAG: hypothetical protein IT302_05065 [Dehalococcoidia bacterium]|nr:hypothetical protein [Dehalococcoidia bacterium]